ETQTEQTALPDLVVLDTLQSALQQAAAGDAAPDGETDALWQQILEELRGLADQLPPELQDAYNDLIDAVEDFVNGEQGLAGKLEALYNGLGQLVEARSQLDAGIQAIIDAYAAQGQELTWEEACALFSQESLASLQAQLEEAKATLDEGKAQLDAGWAQYEAGKAEMEQGRQLLEENAATLRRSRAQLEFGWAQYEEQGTALYEGKHELERSKITLDENWALLA